MVRQERRCSNRVRSSCAMCSICLAQKCLTNSDFVDGTAFRTYDFCEGNLPRRFQSFGCRERRRSRIDELAERNLTHRSIHPRNRERLQSSSHRASSARVDFIVSSSSTAPSSPFSSPTVARFFSMRDWIIVSPAADGTFPCFRWPSRHACRDRRSGASMVWSSNCCLGPR